MMRYTDEHFRVLLDYNSRIGKLCESAFDGKLTIADDDHEGFMCYTFAAKQLEHLEAVRILVDAEKYSDSGVVARLMMEGMSPTWPRPAVRKRRWRSTACRGGSGDVCDPNVLIGAAQ